MGSTERRYDIDWLRVIAIGLLLFYHIAICFQPWGGFVAFIVNKDQIPSIWPAMGMLNIWRIPILFFISGMGVSFALLRRNWGQLLLERTKRILVPLVFGTVAIAPIHFFLLQHHYNIDLKYTPSTSHLWFLANIMVYVLILSGAFILIKRKSDSRFIQGIFKILRNPLGILFVLSFFILESIFIPHADYVTYFSNWHGFTMGMLAFLFGFLFIQSGEEFWAMLRKWKWVYLVLAFTLYFTRLLAFELKSPGILMATESILWIYSLLGICNHYLNRGGKTLAYLSQAAYPVYIIHMAVLYAGCVLLFPLEFSAWLKLIALNVFTFAVSLLIYEFLIRRIKWIRVLFGLRF